MEHKDTLSQTMNVLRDNGLNLLDEHLEDRNRKKTYPIEEFEVDEYFRFKGMTNSGDNSILYAITTDVGHKGMLVDDGYGGASERVLKKNVE